MKSTIETFAIKNIQFSNYSDDIRLMGTYRQNNLSYETELRLEQSRLNRLINQLQKLNPEIFVTDLLESEEILDGEVYYSFDFQNIENTLDFKTLVQDCSYKQIRA